MFKIECYCEDTQLAKILRLLDGKVYNLVSRPAEEAPDNRSGPKKKMNANGEHLNKQVAAVLANNPLAPKFTMAEVEAALKTIGRPNNLGMRSYAIKAMKRSKLAKPTARKGVYVLTSAATR